MPLPLLVWPIRLRKQVCCARREKPSPLQGPAGRCPYRIGSPWREEPSLLHQEIIARSLPESAQPLLPERADVLLGSRGAGSGCHAFFADWCESRPCVNRSQKPLPRTLFQPIRAVENCMARSSSYRQPSGGSACCSAESRGFCSELSAFAAPIYSPAPWRIACAAPGAAPDSRLPLALARKQLWAKTPSA